VVFFKYVLPSYREHPEIFYILSMVCMFAFGYLVVVMLVPKAKGRARERRNVEDILSHPDVGNNSSPSLERDYSTEERGPAFWDAISQR
jgi:hypothetical protein